MFSRSSSEDHFHPLLRRRGRPFFSSGFLRALPRAQSSGSALIKTWNSTWMDKWDIVAAGRYLKIPSWNSRYVLKYLKEPAATGAFSYGFIRNAVLHSGSGPTGKNGDDAPVDTAVKRSLTVYVIYAALRNNKPLCLSPDFPSLFDVAIKSPPFRGSSKWTTRQSIYGIIEKYAQYRDGKVLTTYQELRFEVLVSCIGLQHSFQVVCNPSVCLPLYTEKWVKGFFIRTGNPPPGVDATIDVALTVVLGMHKGFQDAQNQGFGNKANLRRWHGPQSSARSRIIGATQVRHTGGGNFVTRSSLRRAWQSGKVARQQPASLLCAC
jgi:hypothetical protein